MLIFGLLTIQNIRHTRQRIVPLNLILNNRNKKKTIKQMTIMLLVQVVCSILLSLPISLQNIHSEITRNYQKSDEQQQVEEFLGTLFSLITLMNSSISFYIFTLTGQIFRDELKRLLFFKIRVPITAD
jgi:Mn2+/Fe2+ NRAMP family transporter